MRQGWLDLQVLDHSTRDWVRLPDRARNRVNVVYLSLFGFFVAVISPPQASFLLKKKIMESTQTLNRPLWLQCWEFKLMLLRH